MYIAAFVVAGLATVPIIAVLGVTEVRGEGIGQTEILATIAADVVITAILMWWLQRRHREWREAIVLPSIDSQAIGFGLIGGLVLVPAVGVVSAVLEGILTAALDKKVVAPEQLSSGLSPLAAALAVVLAVVVAPFAEEFFFRGILFRTLRDRHGFWLAAFGSAVPFGLVHYVPSPWQDAVLLQGTMVFTGLGLAWIYDRRGTLTANVVAHMTFNLIGVVWILFGSG